MHLSSPDAEVVVDLEGGGRLRSLRVHGHELLVGRLDHPMMWGSFPMIPWAGRIRDARFSWRGTTAVYPAHADGHALHGTTYTRPWTQVADAAIRCDLGPTWPWPGHALQRFELDGGALRQVIEVHAETEPMPASVGWHPWFRRHLDGVAVEVDLAAGAMAERDEAGLPSGRWLRPPPPGPWDDCFAELERPPVVRWPGVLEVEIDSDCLHYVVFDELDHTVCVEPQTDLPDVLNHQPAVVEPGAPLVATTTWRWRVSSGAA
ncbi:MAG: aldose 1-epimerase [Actinomycetota bacterium]